MKQKVLLVAILMMALIMPAVAQDKPRTSPDKAKYSIIGTINYRNGHRWLDNPVGKRIDFEYDETRPATATDSADLEVRFDFVHTDHPMTRLDFWRFDSKVGEWIYDREVRQGDTVAVTRMQTNVMLVIDKSSSLARDFPKVQEAAIEFVNQLYTASREKGVTFRVGIIAFSTIKFTEIREISTLDLTNYNEIVSFISGLKMENGTALYYSLDKALDMLEKDTRMNIRPDEYRESRIYAFTDGLDQASIDDSKGLTNPTQYYESIRPKMLGPQRKLIMNMPRKIVRSTIVTVRGGDMTEKQIQLFDERAEQICDNVRKLDDMTKLVSEFKKLAADLVNSNFMLYCYIPEGANGLVGWTFRDGNVVKERKPIKPSKFWVGLGIEGGKFDSWHHIKTVTGYDYSQGYPIECYSYTDEYPEWIYGGIHLNAAYPISSSFSIGGTVSMTVGSYKDIAIGYAIGPMAKISFKNNSALLMWIEYRKIAKDENGVFDFGLGWKFKYPWYLKAYAGYDNWMFFGVGIGYSISGDK